MTPPVTTTPPLELLCAKCLVGTCHHRPHRGAVPGAVTIYHADALCGECTGERYAAICRQEAIREKYRKPRL